ncbi:MAG: YbaB/EbfC family nucleoid-associated protein [Candidatus Berkiellales bacterium]
MDQKNDDMQSMMASFMQNAKKMQDSLRQAYEELSEKNKDRSVFGKAGGDLVVAQVNLKMQLVNLALKPELFNEKPDVISQLIVAAVNQGLFEAQQTVKQEMMEMTKKVGLPQDIPMPFKDDKE